MNGGSPFAELALLLSFVLVVYYAAHFTDTRPRNHGARAPRPDTPEKVEADEVTTGGPAIAEDRKTQEWQPIAPPPGRRAHPVADTREEDLSQTKGIIPDEVSRPVAFLDPVDWESLGEEQIAEINFIRQQFVTLLGGIDQDPADPTYRARWTSAQKLADEEFRSFFGEEAFNQQQLQAITSSE